MFKKQTPSFFVNDIKPVKKWLIVVLGIIVVIGLTPIVMYFFGLPK